MKACYSLICTRALPERFTPARRSFLAFRVSFFVEPRHLFQPRPLCLLFFAGVFVIGQVRIPVQYGMGERRTSNQVPSPKEWILVGSQQMSSAAPPRHFLVPSPFSFLFFCVQQSGVYCSLLHPPPVSPRKVTSASSTLC